MRWCLVSLLLGVSVGLLGGCGGSVDAGVGTSGESYSIGSPERYREPGVYDDHVKAHGVWVVSHEGWVFVYERVCPYGDGGQTVHDELANYFKCDRCAARFGVDGLPRGTTGGASVERRSLRRVWVGLMGGRDAADAHLKVDPAQTFAQEANQWSSRWSMFALDPRVEAEAE